MKRRKGMVAKTCEGCGDTFRAARTDWRFHSPKCREKHEAQIARQQTLPDIVCAAANSTQHRNKEHRMSTSLPVYNLNQWIKTGTIIGRIVARCSTANTFECLEEFAHSAHVQGMVNRGAGYCIEWVELQYEDWPTVPMTPDVKAKYATPYRRSWLRAETIAEKRYQPCENPVAPKVEAEKPEATEPSNVDAETTIESKDNAESVMRAMVDAGRRAEDWLRAYGFTP